MLAYAACDRHHTGQVVMQGTTLVVRIIGTVVVLSTTVMRMVMVHVIDPAALGEVGSNILLALERMLDMDAN